MQDLKDKIWITARTRMITEQRYKRYDIRSHLFISYMSLLMILTTIFSEDLSSVVPYFRQLEVVIPLALFAASLIVYGFKFGDCAHQFRECYLKLQSLYEKFDKTSDPTSEYEEILQRYPNHAESDYEELIIKRTLFDRQKISSGGVNHKWTYWMIAKWLGRVTWFWFFVVGLPLTITAHFLLSMIVNNQC